MCVYWLFVLTLSAAVSAQTNCGVFKDPSINTVGYCIPHAYSDNGFNLYKYEGHNYRISAEITYDVVYNVDDPFNPVFVKNITNLNQCRGGVFTHEKLGDYFVHFGNSNPTCNCTEGQPCIPYLNSSVNGKVSEYRFCDNSVYPANTKDVSGPGAVANPIDACTTISADLSGKFAVAMRGTCSFQVKLNNLYAAGAIGVVIVNLASSSGTSLCSQPSLSSASIPFIMSTYDDGILIINSILNGSKVILSLGPTWYFKLNSSKLGPFDKVWGSLQYVQIAHMSATKASDFKLFKDTSRQSYYNPSGVIGFASRPDDEKTNLFLLSDGTNFVVASVINGNFSIITNPGAIPSDNIARFSVSILFKRDGLLFLSSPNFFLGKSFIYSLTQVGSGQTPVLRAVLSVNVEGSDYAATIPPANNYLYSASTAGSSCPRQFFIFNATNMAAPKYLSSFQTIIKPGGGSDQFNLANFIEASDGTIVGAFCMTSEGVMIYNANSPSEPYVLGTYDPSFFEGTYGVGAQGCTAGTDGLTWWFVRVEDRAVCAVRLLYGPGGSLSNLNSAGSMIDFHLVIGFFIFCLMLWN